MDDRSFGFVASPVSMAPPQNVDEAALCEQYLRGVVEKNKEINLTRIDSLAEGRLLHIEDSLLALEELRDCPAGDLVDLGSGGGFPGVPLAFATGRSTVLVDSVKKKMAAVAAILKEMSSTASIETYGGRAEELAKERPAAFSVATARALAALPSLLELAAPLLCVGGRLICYKASEITDELAWACRVQGKLGMQYVSSREATLSDGTTKRRIVVFEKVGEPQVRLPRNPGIAQKRPYKK